MLLETVSDRLSARFVCPPYLEYYFISAKVLTLTTLNWHSEK